MSKGSAYEREVCKLLSRWWTDGERDDIFWRSSNSGGRATVRKRQGKGTHGSYGDVAATDPIGEPLLKLFTIELKRGYSDCSVLDLVDALPGTKLQIAAFIEQAATAAENAGTPYWLLVHRRNRRLPLAIFPWEAVTHLKEAGMVAPSRVVSFRVNTLGRLVVIPMKDLLLALRPKAVEWLVRERF